MKTFLVSDPRGFSKLPREDGAAYYKVGPVAPGASGHEQPANYSRKAEAAFESAGDSVTDAAKDVGARSRTPPKPSRLSINRRSPLCRTPTLATAAMLRKLQSVPELAEVEYFRRRWDDGIGQRVVRVDLHGKKRVFRDSDPNLIEKTLRGKKLLGSETGGKQIAFRFSKDAWLGIHLGMSGKLRVEAADFTLRKHDHLALFQKTRTLVFSDPRMFGRVRFYVGKDMPDWWASLPPAVTSREFTAARLRHILQRRRRTSLKALLLIQEFFPGVGNWMADEILWQARLHPQVVAGALDAAAARELLRVMRSVCRVALKTIGVDWSDPPANWLIHQRWKETGRCPTHGIRLKHATVGGRTTAWCPRCQKLTRSRRARAAP